MFIEEILEKFILSGLSGVSRFDKQILISLNSQSWSMTENQRKLLEKLLNRYKHLLEQIFQKNIDMYLEFPKYQKEIRIKSNLKQISLVKNFVEDNFIKIEFPYDPDIIQEIQSKKPQLTNAKWDQEKKHWKLALAEKNLVFCQHLFENFGFTICDNIKNFFDQLIEIQKNLENHLPMLEKLEQGYFFKNFPFFTENLGTDLLPALFIARKYGITYWSDTIEKELKDCYDQTLIQKFLKSSIDEKFSINLTEIEVDHLKIIIKFLTPCLITLPVGNELSKLKFTANLLSDAGILNNEMSVLFRLSNQENPEFNEFVKNNKLNSPLDENIKAVFVGNKMPKPLIEQKIYFNSIISYNYHHAHYTIINFSKNHQNILQIN